MLATRLCKRQPLSPPQHIVAPERELRSRALRDVICFDYAQTLEVVQKEWVQGIA